MKLKPKLLAMASTIALAGCTTTPTTQAPQAAGSIVQAVPCPSLKIIHYHAPTDAGAAAWAAGTLPDPQNQYDTPETVTSTRQQNAAIHAVCKGD